jgi:cytochrome c oxidase accessory protein FixG
LNTPVPSPTVPLDLSPEEVALYEIRKRIYPRAVYGWFATWRWGLVFVTQAIYYGLPWFTWNGRQAVLFDLGARKFYLFGLVFWPQDVMYLSALLILSALSLFLFTAVAGRLWCGYACPQTVYTEIFTWIERKIEGDRLARIRLDVAALSLHKLAIKAAKHSTWLVVALWTGFSFVGYFTPIRELGIRALGGQLGAWQSFWILFYGLATYGNAGLMREQVCMHLCPYARLQDFMFDPDTLVITYDSNRGEPRGARPQAVERHDQGLGDCVSCNICVQVCPTGIDIRNGLQYECIGCGACIDGCNQVMQRYGYPPGLIRYTTAHALARGYDAKAMWRQVLRPRTVVYAAVLLAIAGVTASALATRKSPLNEDVMRDRRPLAGEVASGAAGSGSRVQWLNTDRTASRPRDP